jgi:hypothetical protein
MVSMDGVTQAPGGPTEDPTKSYKFGGWVMPYFDQECGEELGRPSLWYGTGHSWFPFPSRGATRPRGTSSRGTR